MIMTTTQRRRTPLYRQIIASCSFIIALVTQQASITVEAKLVLPGSLAATYSTGRLSFSGKQNNGALSSLSASPSTTKIVMDLRGGASKSKAKKGPRTGSLNKKAESSQKTATGSKKVGSKAAAEKEKKGALSDSLQKYKKILPLTRIYITMVGVATLLGLILGEELTQSLLAFDPMRVFYGFELWRPFTAASFLGPPSISWLMSGYYLFEYGSSLERAYGSAQHLVFLLSQVFLLSIFSGLVGQPFFAPSVITAMLHVLSRAMPYQKIKWLVFTVPYWSLPYGLMVTDVLQAQSPMAALPHIMGILSGHFYQFHKFVWPKMGGEDWLTPPNFVQRLLDPDARTEKLSASGASKLSKSRIQNKGRKLGGS